METWGLIISAVSGCATVLGFIGIFVKYGKDQGVLYTTLRQLVEKTEDIPDKNVIAEMRKDVDKNAKDINALGTKVNQMQLENSKMITALSSDLGWIKASLTDIKQEISRKKE